MLTKKDLKETEEHLEKRLGAKIEKVIKDAFSDFYDNIFAPYVERNEKDHDEIKKEMRKGREELNEYIKDHENRVRKLEVISGN